MPARRRSDGNKVHSLYIFQSYFYLKVLIKTVRLFWDAVIVIQGLTLRFQARGPKRTFDKFSDQKQDFCIITYTISGPSLKDLGAHSKI